MRRVTGYAAFTVGLTLVFLAPLLRFYVTPRVEKAPTDILERSVAEGTGRYFIISQATLSEPRRLRNITITKADPERSTSELFVGTQFSRTIDLDTGQDIDYSLETYVMDRRTGEAVDHPAQDPPKEGFTLKLPFGVERDQVYPFYDSTARRAFPARFVRTDEVEDLDVFVLVSEAPDTVIDEGVEVPGFIVGRPEEPTVVVDRHYTAVTTLWVEPETGAILKGAQRAMQWFEDQDGNRTVLSETDFATTPERVREVADKIKNGFAGHSGLTLLRVQKIWVPIFGPVAGVILVVVGLVLLRRRVRPAPG